MVNNLESAHTSGYTLAFAEYYNQNWAKLHRRLVASGIPENDVSDIVQATFLAIWRNKYPELTKSLLHVVVTNKVTDYFRSIGNQPVILSLNDGDFSDPSLDTEAIPDEIIIESGSDLRPVETLIIEHETPSEVTQRYSNLLSRLSPQRKRNFELFLKGYNYKQIAALTNKSEGTIRTSLSRTITQLKSNYK